MSVRSVPFMELPTAPWILFGLLLFLGALNFQLVRHGEASSILSSLKRFGEAEIGIGVTVILAAASLTSLPPAADLTQDRVSGAEIYARMRELTRQGVGIVMVSSELPELLGMSDRIVVFHEGRRSGELARAEATEEAVMHLATGAPASAAVA